MTLTIHEDIEQGTQEWLDARRGLITASVVGQLITPTLKVADNETSRGLTTLLASERIAGRTEDGFTNRDMFRGILAEPIARDLYSTHYQQASQVGFMVKAEGGWTLGYSPDGVVGTDGLIEVKAPRPKTHVSTILADEVPGHYMAQCQAGLLVSGRDWLDFVSYSAGLPLFVKRVLPDPDWFDVIADACFMFEQNVTTICSVYEQRAAGMPPTEYIDFNNLEVI